MESLGSHSSHFGSRYTLVCCACTGLLFARVRSLPRAGIPFPSNGEVPSYTRLLDCCAQTRGFRGSRRAGKQAQLQCLTRSPLEGETFSPLPYLKLEDFLRPLPGFHGFARGRRRGALARRRARRRQRSSRTAVPKRDSGRQELAKSRTQRAGLTQ